MNYQERAIRFECDGACLYGILSVPAQASTRGVLIVVGGPQYRAGSHRQFTLLARHLATQGIPVMRFDYRGMGDSYGEIRTFESIDTDIRHAVDKFASEIPAMKELVIWGLCDAASAAVFYAPSDRRICGLVLLNPWVRTEEGIAKAYLKHYYLTRLLDRNLWRKIFTGGFNYQRAARSLFEMIMRSRSRPECERLPHSSVERRGDEEMPLPERMLAGLVRFEGKVLLILSGNDLTAKEFQDLIDSSRQWQKMLRSPKFDRRDLPEANHTFSRRAWRDQVASWTKDWIVSW